MASFLHKLFHKAAPPAPPGLAAEAPDSKYRTGQVWKYRSRPQEPDSTLVVVQIETTEKLGDIVHISVRGLKLQRPDGGVGETIGHMPFAVKSIEESVTELVREGAEVPDFHEGHAIWRSAFEAGKAGVFTTSVAEAVGFIEQAMQG